MKKLITMILLLSICLGGCAKGEAEAQTEAATTVATQGFADNNEKPEETEIITAQTEETTEPFIEIEPTQTQLLMQFLDENREPAAEEQIEVQRYLRPFEKGLYVLMQDSRRLFDDVYEGVDYFAQEYYECQYNKSLFAWQLAQHEPTIEVKYDVSVDSDFPAGKTGMPKEAFENYYMSLFGESVDIPQLCRYDAYNGYFAEENDALCFHCYEGAHDAVPVLKNPKLQYEDGVYYLTMDVLAQQQRQYVNGRFQYTFAGDYLNYADPTIINYPEEYVFAKVVFQLSKTENGYRFGSLEFKDVNPDTYTLTEESNPYVGKTLVELLDLMPRNEQMSEDLMIGVQAALKDKYQEAICWLAMSDDWEVEPESNYDYLASPEGKTIFTWYQMANGEKRHPSTVRFEGQENATGSAVVKIEDFNHCCRELLGVEVDVERLNEIKWLTVSHEQGTMSGSPLIDDSLPSMKNPILTYDAVLNEYLLTMELVDHPEYRDYSITEYLPETVVGTITFRLVKADDAWHFRSIVMNV